MDTRRIFCQYPGDPTGRGRYMHVSQLRYRPCAYAIIFDEAERVLMVCAPVLRVRWNLPGGGVNQGETLIEGLRREVMEETGLEVEVGPLVLVQDQFYIMATGWPVQAVRHFYLARPSGGKLNPNGNGFDSGVVDYIDLNKIPVYELHDMEDLYPIIDRARALLPTFS
jgi:8-oxo-dGTP pyrophosphatase MutT (NUDIX family)